MTTATARAPDGDSLLPAAGTRRDTADMSPSDSTSGEEADNVAIDDGDVAAAIECGHDRTLQRSDTEQPPQFSSSSNRGRRGSEPTLPTRTPPPPPTTTAPLTTGSKSNMHSTVDTMRRVDQIRHRLKRPSTTATLLSRSNNPHSNSSNSSTRSNLLQSLSSVSGFLRLRHSAREWRMKTWFCVLYNAHLYWYASKKDAQVAKRLQGQIRVVRVCVSTGAGKIHTYPHAFLVTAKNGHVYLCAAPTADDQQHWLAALQASTTHPRVSLHQPRSDGSTSSTHSDSQSSSLGADVDELDDDNALHTSPVLLAHKTPTESLSFRRARATGRLELTATRRASSSSSSDDDNRACSACDLTFRLLRRRRHVCSSCCLSFCRWHCAQYVPLEFVDDGSTTSSGTRMARVCDACAQRQHFITFAVALTATLVARLRDPAAAFAQLCPHDCFARTRARSDRHSVADVGAQAPHCHRRQWRELELIVASPASFTVLNVLCLLKKYQRMPWLFARTLCLMIPLVEANDSEDDDDSGSLSTYWNQYLSMFVPLVQSVYPENEYDSALDHSTTMADDVYVTSDEQLASLWLYIDVTLAICRRSPPLALRTVWECLALYEDAQQSTHRHHSNRVVANYILLLIYLVSAFDRDSDIVANLWLLDAPDAQADAVVAAMDDYMNVADAVRAAAPPTLALQWIYATHPQAQRRLTKRIQRNVLSTDATPRQLLQLLAPIASSDAMMRDASLYETVLSVNGDDVDAFVSALDSDDDENDEANDEAADSAHARLRAQQFNAEANFVHNLVDIAEHLRHVTPVAARSSALPALLQRLQLTLNGDSVDAAADAVNNLQYLPLDAGSSSDRAPTILRVVVNEGKVFSTRCRAPTLIVFEAIAPAQSVHVRHDEATAAASALDDNDDDSDEDDDDAVPMSASQRKLARQDSEMLDRMLCSFDKQAIATLIGRSRTSLSASSSSSSSTPSFALLDDEENEDKTDDSDDVENEPPPEELAQEDARLVYEESMSACMRRSNDMDDSAAAAGDAGGVQVDALAPLASHQHRQQHESWAAKTERIRAASPYRDVPGWTLVSVIAKSFDDLRQEVFALQLLTTLQAIFHGNDLRQLYLRPYRILCTGANCGLIETLTDALSIDAVKKQHGSLALYFTALFGTDEHADAFRAARHAFVVSMAASSVYCYLFQVKDRHNGNIMIDRDGHIMHIDFGFILGIMPGGNWSLEKDAPFKLTIEMVELMGGLESTEYELFRQLFLDGMLAVRREYVKLLSLIHLTAADAPFPCFQAQSPGTVLGAFRRRLFLDHSDAVATTHILRLVDKSYNNWGMRQYDKFQRSTNGIMP